MVGNMENPANKNLSSEGYRYERKFLIDDLDYDTAFNLVYCSTAGFIEAYPPRMVNNIYYDTFDFSSFHENVDGISDRMKTRIRWYGEDTEWARKLVLEYKMKDSMLGTKKSYSLSGLSFRIDNDLGVIHDALELQQNLPEGVRIEMMRRTPILANRYKRDYLISADGLYRLTIDTDMQYYPICNNKINWCNVHSDMKSIILELKYPVDLDNGVNDVSNTLPFRLTKNSKYVTGMFYVYA